MRKKLKKLREEKGHTQKSFSKKIKISKRTYEQYEQGRRFPSETMLMKIMKALETNDISIFENIEEDENLTRGDITKSICDFMNKTTKENKLYTPEIIRIIRSSIVQERENRKKEELNIRSYSEKGKLEIFKRVSKIANEKILKERLNMKISSNDVRLYKNCTRLEFENRTGKTTWSKADERRRNGCSSKTGKFIDV